MRSILLAAVSFFVALEVSPSSRGQGLILAPGTSRLYSVVPFGISLDASADLDGDGYADFVAGDPGFFAQGQILGAVWVYSGRGGSLIDSYLGSTYGATLGEDVSVCADLSGDGMPDFLMGESFSLNSGVSPGLVHVVAGSTGAILYSVQGTQFSESFGFTVTGGGDVDLDGWGDFAAQAVAYDTSQSQQAGAVRVISGIDGSLIREFEGNQSGISYGSALDMRGDVDGDSRADLLVGTRSWGKGLEKSVGKLDVFSGLDGSSLFSTTGPHKNDNLGAQVAYIGDMTGDGRDEFVFSADAADLGGFERTGRIDAVDPSSWSTLWTLAGVPGEALGTIIAFVGDVQGDSNPDLLAEGNTTVPPRTVHLVDGSTGSIVGSFWDAAASIGFGSSLGGGGDLTGDGLSDLVISDLVINVHYTIQANSLSVTGNPAPGATVFFDHNAPAAANDPYLLVLSFGQSGVPFGARTIPLSPDPLFLASFGAPALGGVLDGQGQASLPFGIPANPNLSGLTFYGASLIVDFAYPLGARAITNGAAVTIQ